MQGLRWLDFDAEQARRTTELLRSLEEPDTVDSLGLGAIRDGLAEILFPGTTTVQTRARYFLLVPWACQQVARERPRTRTAFDDRLKAIEIATITSLLQGSPPSTRGIIGSLRRERTRNLPSAIYWAGLEAWGIRREVGMSRSAYRDHVLAGHARDLLADESGDGTFFRVFDELPTPPIGFPDEPMSIIPSADEAAYLLERMKGTLAPSSGIPGALREEPSLLAVLAGSPGLAAEPAPWRIAPSAMTPFLARTTWLAHGFSLVMQGARLKYLDGLFAGRARSGFDEPGTRGRFDELVAQWQEAIDDQAPLVEQWTDSVGDLFDHLSSVGVAIGKATREFVAAWARDVALGPEAAFSSGANAARIERREREVKVDSARLGSRAQYEKWTGALFGSAYMDFRWGTASTMVDDCRRGLQGGDHART